jgi:hypothetical protein
LKGTLAALGMLATAHFFAMLNHQNVHRIFVVVWYALVQVIVSILSIKRFRCPSKAL